MCTSRSSYRDLEHKMRRRSVTDAVTDPSHIERPLIYYQFESLPWRYISTTHSSQGGDELGKNVHILHARTMRELVHHAIPSQYSFDCTNLSVGKAGSCHSHCNLWLHVLPSRHSYTSTSITTGYSSLLKLIPLVCSTSDRCHSFSCLSVLSFVPRVH